MDNRISSLLIFGSVKSLFISSLCQFSSADLRSELVFSICLFLLFVFRKPLREFFRLELRVVLCSCEISSIQTMIKRQYLGLDL